MMRRVDGVHNVAVVVQEALREAANRVVPVDTPDTARWHALGRRLRVDPEGVRKHEFFDPLTGGRVTSWEVSVFVDPSQTPMYPVYELMSLAEEWLEDRLEDNFLLVPAVLAGSEQQ